MISELTSSIANIVKNSEIVKRARKYNLDIVSSSWEDCARYKDKAFGPNISDITLCLSAEEIRLPIIRQPNYEDITFDIKIDEFYVTVGNEVKQAELKRISLKKYLENKKGYMKDALDMPIPSLLNNRDSIILTSLQYCVLPLKEGKCEFTANIFNYQVSLFNYPAILVIVASHNGTSVQLVNKGTTSLYFNNAGMAANFTAQRLKEVLKDPRKKKEVESENNYLHIIQVPLKRQDGPVNETGFLMDDAVIGVGSTIKPFPVIESCDFVRDERYPIRCTVQYYKVTDKADIPELEFKKMNETFESFKEGAEKYGSLVFETTDRISEPYLKELPEEEYGKKLFSFLKRK